jgi:hypothetical protein
MGVLGDETLHCIAAKSTATDAGKDRLIRQSLAFAQPNLKCSCRFRAEWGATLFSAFPKAANVGARPENNILAVEPDQLGNPQARLDTYQKKGSIPTPQPSGKIWNGKQRIDLVAVEKLDGPLFVTLIGNRQDALAMQRQRGLL